MHLAFWALDSVPSSMGGKLQFIIDQFMNSLQRQVQAGLHSIWCTEADSRLWCTGVNSPAQSFQTINRPFAHPGFM